MEDSTCITLSTLEELETFLVTSGNHNFELIENEDWMYIWFQIMLSLTNTVLP